MSNKYSQKLLNTAKKSTANAIKAVSKREIQKIAGTTGDLIGNTIADKVTSVSKNILGKVKSEIKIRKGRYMSPEKDNKLLMNLCWYNNMIMEYQKITNLLETTSNQPSKFRRKNWIEIGNWKLDWSVKRIV